MSMIIDVEFSCDEDRLGFLFNVQKVIAILPDKGICAIKSITINAVKYASWTVVGLISLHAGAFFPRDRKPKVIANTACISDG